MERTSGFSFARYYLRAHLWLRHRCDRLTARQRKVIVYGLSLVYFACSIWMIAQFFLPHDKEERLSIPKGKIIDSDIHTDSVFIRLYQQYSTNSNENG